jgi:urocanate hydratase
MVAKAGAGPPPIHHKDMSASKLAEAIRYCLSDKASVAAQALAHGMSMEIGVQTAAESFHRHLPRERMQCDLLHDQPAVWSYTKGKKPLKLSKAAAQTLVSQNQIEMKHLKM